MSCWSAFTGGYVFTLGQQFRDADGPLGRVGLVGTVAVATLIAGLYFWKPIASVGLLALYGLLVSVPVNPVYRGLAPLDQQPLVDEMRGGGRRRRLVGLALHQRRRHHRAHGPGGRAAQRGQPLPRRRRLAHARPHRDLRGDLEPLLAHRVGLRCPARPPR